MLVQKCCGGEKRAPSKMICEFVGCVLAMSDQRRSWARLSAGFREDIYIYVQYIGRVDKEELEVVKWLWPSLEKEWK